MKQQLFPSILLQRGIGLVAGCWLVGANAQPPIMPNEFGAAVTSVGDVNGDGIPDFLVGAPSQIVSGRGPKGMAFVLSGADGRPLHILANPTLGSRHRLSFGNGRFGTAVASAGDVNGDGTPDLLVGAPFQSQVFVFSGADGRLLHTLDDPTPQERRFGAAVASTGDVNGDGAPDFLVGAPGNEGGQAFVFSGIEGSLLRTLETPIDTPYIRLHAPRTWRVGQKQTIVWSLNAIRGNRTAKIQFAKDGVRFRAIRNVKVRRGEITWKPKRRSVTEQGVLRICVKPAPRVPQVCHSLDISVHGTGQPVQGRLYGRRHGPG